VELVEIAAGWFWMGWDAGVPAEAPRHQVYVDGFAIATTPVTNAQYAAFLTTDHVALPPFWSAPGYADSDQPVVGVSWAEAMAYCGWLTARSGRPHRLPTEAEWEKAARGGVDGARYAWGEAPPPAVFRDVRLPRTAPPRVGDGPRNGFGLTDLAGCVHEWCLDWHDDGYYAVAPARNPRGPASGVRRVSRGGAWRHQDPWSPVAHRSSLPPHLRYSDYGFRVAQAR
jgi:formylglycine-generating enzyme required for sulfatase activity